MEIRREYMHDPRPKRYGYIPPPIGIDNDYTFNESTIIERFPEEDEGYELFRANYASTRDRDPLKVHHENKDYSHEALDDPINEWDELEEMRLKGTNLPTQRKIDNRYCYENVEDETDRIAAMYDKVEIRPKQRVIRDMTGGLDCYMMDKSKLMLPKKDNPFRIRYKNSEFKTNAEVDRYDHTQGNGSGVGSRIRVGFDASKRRGRGWNEGWIHDEMVRREDGKTRRGVVREELHKTQVHGPCENAALDSLPHHELDPRDKHNGGDWIRELGVMGMEYDGDKEELGKVYEYEFEDRSRFREPSRGGVSDGVREYEERFEDHEKSVMPSVRSGRFYRSLLPKRDRECKREDAYND